MDNLSGIYPDNLVSGKYYLIEQDPRFPLQPTGEWQQFQSGVGQTVKIPKQPCIYILSGYGVQYIGMDWRGTRGNDHRNAFLRNDHINSYMQNKVNSHGISGFFYQPLITLPLDVTGHINIIENAYIKHFDTYRNGYNLVEFSDTPMLGRKFSEEVRKKMSENHGDVRGSKNPNFGNKCPHHVKEATKVKNSRTYTLVSPSGEKISFIGLKKFCKENNLDRKAIYLMIIGERLSHHGWTVEDTRLPKKVKGRIKGPPVISPNGEIVTDYLIADLCNEYNLNRSNFQLMLDGKNVHCKQWRKLV